MDLAILDTDMLSEVVKKKDSRVHAMALKYIAQYQQFSFSAITAYEIVRGLHARNASQQLKAFLAMVNKSEVLPVNFGVLMRAAELWAEGRQNGYPHNDADLIIAATALESGRVLVTGNSNHYQWINGLQTLNWRST